MSSYDLRYDADAWETAQVRMAQGRIRDFTGDVMQTVWEPEDIQFMQSTGTSEEEMLALATGAA